MERRSVEFIMLEDAYGIDFGDDTGGFVSRLELVLPILSWRKE